MIVECEKSEKICLEWAKDFEHMGWNEEGEKYRNLAAHFALGLEPNKIKIMEEIKNLEDRISGTEEALNAVGKLLPDKKARKNMNKINRETHFLIERLHDLVK